MEKKQPIDIKRDSGGWSDIGTFEDGPILEMTKIGSRLIVIKQRAIYETIFADEVDPKRTNIELPNIIQKLLINQGADSELVSITFLTAKALFKNEYFNNSIDIEKILKLALDLLQEMIILEEEITIYLLKEKSVSDEYENKRDGTDSYSIPTIVSLETSCKTIFQKADHVEQILMEIITVFYSKDGLTKQSHFPKFNEVLEKKYGKNAPFPKFINSTLYFMKIIRLLRNGLDHRLDTVIVKNFELQPDSSIISPSIELNHKDETLEKTSLSSFLPIVLQNMILIIENTFVGLADKNVKKDYMQFKVKKIPVEKRRYKFVEYSFWSPLGPGGFFHQ